MSMPYVLRCTPGPGTSPPIAGTIYAAVADRIGDLCESISPPREVGAGMAVEMKIELMADATPDQVTERLNGLQPTLTRVPD